jgi:hypothetical protein
MILHFARSLQATDPKDHIYGLLALMDIPIQQDYSLSVRDVYCDFASTCILQSERLDVLMFAGLSMTYKEQSNTQISTWVPN